MKSVNDEGIKDINKFLNSQEITREFLEGAIEFILQKIDRNLDTFTHLYPAPASINNIYPAIDNIDWTSSFWTGMLWLAYEVTGDERYRNTAEVQLSI